MIVHLLTEVLAFVGKGTLQFLRKFLFLVKILVYFFAIIRMQSVLITKMYNVNTGACKANNYVEILLLMDVSFFYFSLVACCIFNMVIRFRKFHTIKERIVGKMERFKEIG